MILYMYDESGLPMGMQYKATGSTSWTVYYYERNLQGDVIALYSSSGTKLVTYTYDAYGNATVLYSSGSASTPAAKNPFRYRGYYYDLDLSMYLLGTRYYDSQICRFISPDNVDVTTATPMALTDKNLFAYCDNNPVMRVDRDGEFWITLGRIVVGAAINTFTAYLGAVVTGQEFTWEDALVAAIAGGVGATGPVGTVLSGIGSGLYTGISDYLNGASIGTSILNGALSAFTTIASISNLASIGLPAGFGNTAFEFVTMSVSDLVFGSGSSMLTSALSYLFKETNPKDTLELPSIETSVTSSINASSSTYSLKAFSLR